MLHMNDITKTIKEDINKYNDGLYDDIGCIDSIVGICREYLEQERCKCNTKIDDIETILGYNKNVK